MDTERAQSRRSHLNPVDNVLSLCERSKRRIVFNRKDIYCGHDPRLIYVPNAEDVSDCG